MLDEVVRCLACPVCGSGLGATGSSLRCPSGHSFDIARQGYVNLLPGGARPGTADTAEMVEARAGVLAAGTFSGLAEKVASAAVSAAAGAQGCVVDVGAGTGYHIATVLDALPDRVGLALDISKHAARRAARAHERIGAAVADTWARLPIRDGAAAIVLDVFAPRNIEEFARILAPDGAIIVVTPTPRHLAELVSALGLLTVDERKEERLAQALAGRFVQVATEVHEEHLSLTRAGAAAQATMGPTARHANAAELAAAASGLDEPFSATLSVRVSLYRRLQPVSTRPE